MISELNGYYWDDAMDACYRAGVDMGDGRAFYDFIYSYCGYSI